MLNQAKTLIPAYREEFDRDPLIINLVNGTLRFVQDEGGGWSISGRRTSRPTG
jgi:hypothetical protein